jgi:ABC-2 type transport system ATP-binding protein
MDDIALDVIKVKFRKKHVLNDISFSVKKCSIFGITGRSGSGKSTLIKVILGLVKSKGGKIVFYKDDKPAKNFKKIIGYASQENAFYYKLSVMENLKLFASLYNVRSKDLKSRINDVLNIFDLVHAKDTLAEHLSGGMKRRLDLALSVVHDPEVIIMDEPTNGLDINLQNDLWNYILKLNEMGKTIIISTHNINDIQKYCTDFGVIFKEKFYTKARIKEITSFKVSDLEKMIHNLYMIERENENS